MDEKSAKRRFDARGFFDAVVGPFNRFSRTWLARTCHVGGIALPVAGFVMGPMSNPYTIPRSFEATVGAVRGSIGLIATFAGIAAGGSAR